MARDDDRDRDDEDDPPEDADSRDQPDDDPPPARDARHEIASRPMPLQLIGAIMASILWGGLLLHGSCVSFTHYTMGVIAHHNNVWNVRVGGAGEGFYGTMAATEFFTFLLAATLVVAGVLLMLRKGFAKWMAMGVPVVLILLHAAAAVICLIITSGVFLAQHNFDFLISITFNLVVGGLNAWLLLNKDASAALN